MSTDYVINKLKVADLNCSITFVLQILHSLLGILHDPLTFEYFDEVATEKYHSV